MHSFCWNRCKKKIGNVSNTSNGIKFETAEYKRVFINISSIGTTATDVKEFLAQQYANGTPVTVIYPLVTPTEEDIKLPVLPTIKGSTTYSVGTSVQTYIKYKE